MNNIEMGPDVQLYNKKDGVSLSLKEIYLNNI